MGFVGDQGIKYMGESIGKFCPLEHITFSENKNLRWTKESKDCFIEGFRKQGYYDECSVLSINVHSDLLDNHSYFVGSLALICENRRKYYLMDYEARTLTNCLDTETFELENMEKDKICESFSIKNYL